MGASAEGSPVAGYQRWTIWAKRDDGHLASLHDSGPLTKNLPVWVDRGLLAAGPGSQGVSAVGWGGTEQRAYFIDEVNNILVRYKLNTTDCPNGCANSYSPPTQSKGVYRVLTGHFVASARRSSVGGYTELVFATIKDTAASVGARLYVAEINPTSNVLTWVPFSGFGSYQNLDPTRPLATTAGSDPAWPFKWPRVFAADRDGRVVTVRFNSTNPLSGWQVALVNRPNNDDPNYHMFVAAAAAEANVNGYLTYLFCTRDSPNDTSVYVLRAAGEGSLNFAWQPAESTGPDGPPVVNGYALASTGSTGAGSGRIDAFVVTNAALAPALQWITQLPGAALGHFHTLPPDSETAMRRAGLTATAPVAPVVGASGYSNLFFLGPIGTAGRLYRQKGQLYPFPTSNFANHGPASLDANLNGNRLTEGSTALWRGNAVHVAMQANGLQGGGATAHTIQAFWSSDDGASWAGPTPVTLGVNWSHHADPTVDFDYSGTAWITALAGQNPGCVLPTSSSVFYQTMTAGLLGAAVPIDPAQSSVPFCDSTCSSNCRTLHRFDHPWVAIDREGGRIHVVWTYRAQTAPNCPQQPRIRYATSALPNPDLSGIVTLNVPWQGGANGAGSLPMVSVGAQGATYVATGEGICRVSEITWNSCRGTLEWDPLDNDSQTNNESLPIPGTASPTLTLAVPAAFSIVASPTNADIVYYAFQRFNAVTGSLEVWTQVLTYVPAQEAFQTAAKVQLWPDGAAGSTSGDQFIPSLTVSRDRTDTEFVFASWYDRKLPTNDFRIVGNACGQPVGGQTLNANRCYRVMRGASYDQGLTWGYLRDLTPVALSDPANLPMRCPATTQTFLGDYHGVVADRLHTFTVHVRAPPPGGLANTADLIRSWLSGGFF